MAQITIVYKDFEEMKAVAREILKGTDAQPKTFAAETPDPKESSQAYGRQTASLSSNTNVGVAPVQTTPVQNLQAPVTSAVPVQTAVPTKQHEYTMDDLARAAMTVMDKGGMADLQQLLAGYGCESLQQLPKEQYGNFATALRGMGAQI
ncbi:hypothetical protein [Mediterraneibacter sp. ICN-202921]|uniref:hypothetical protein n=1 Tax=Mediterraneibacter sp. ICN-202921 TaxID=3134657 RepID=UPI0030BDDB10